jgi:dienelactone hydrolase
VAGQRVVVPLVTADAAGDEGDDVRKQFKDTEFQFGLEIALGAAYRQASDVGESLATAGRITDGDADSWVNEWMVTAGVSQAAGAEAESAGRRVSALSHYRRAATYYATALYRFSGVTDHSPERELELWRRQRACWERIVDLQAVPGERIRIPYEDTTLQGFFFRAPDAAPGEQRPLVVMNNGSDGATSAMWLEGGAAAAERGYHWMTFDGPGQQAALYEQGISFRHDWEAVLTPVLDAMVARPDVDDEHVALIGMSQAGYWVPRAIAFEHRFAAAVADGGVVDVSAGWIKPLPEMMRQQLRDGDRDAFDREMRAAESESPAAKARLDFRAKPYGFNGGSRFDLYQEVASYRLGDEVTHITTPLLITDPDDEQFFPGQPQQLHDLVPGTTKLIRFTADEGANGHCEPMARSLRDTRIFDWLEGYLR